jgi:hypothetical protein
VVEETLVGDVLELVLELDVAVIVSGPITQEHALESRDAEDEHGDAKAGIVNTGATQYVEQNAEALEGWFVIALKQLSASQTGGSLTEA